MTVVAAIVHEWELVLVAGLALLIATVLTPHRMWTALIICAAAGAGLVIGRLSR